MGERRVHVVRRAVAAGVVAAALMSGLAFCLFGCNPQQMVEQMLWNTVDNFTSQLTANATGGLGGYVYGTDPTEGAAVQGAVRLAARGTGSVTSRQSSNQLGLAEPNESLRATTGIVPRSRILVRLLDRDMPGGTGPLSFEVVAGLNGNFTIPALPEGERVGITALPPQGQEQQYAPSSEQTLTVTSGRRGRILSALTGEPIGELPDRGVRATDYFPLNVGDVRVYQRLDSTTFRPYGEAIPEYVGAQVVLTDMQGNRLGGDRYPFVFLQPSDPEGLTGTVAGDFWRTSENGIEYFGQTDFIEEMGGTRATILDPPLLFPNGLNMGQVGEAAPRAWDGFVGLAPGTASMRQTGSGITYQLVEIGSTPYQVPAGSFNDWIRIRYAFQLSETAYFVLEYVLAKNVGIIERADYFYDSSFMRTRPEAYVTQLISAVVNGQQVGGFQQPPEEAPPQVEVWSHWEGQEVYMPVDYIYGSIYALEPVTELEVKVNDVLQPNVWLDVGLAMAAERQRKRILARQLPGGYIEPGTEAPEFLEFPFWGEMQFNPGWNTVKVIARTERGIEGATQFRVNFVGTGAPTPVEPGSPVQNVYQIQVIWDTADDIDSYVIGPDGGIYRSFFNPYGPGIDIMDSTAYGPETTTIFVDQGDSAVYSFGIAGYLVSGRPTVRVTVTSNGELVTLPTQIPTQRVITDQIAGNDYVSTDPAGSFYSWFQLEVNEDGSVDILPPVPNSSFWLNVRAAAARGVRKAPK